jgi:glutathione-specific gamma-glutamylcyclotransferase
VATDAFAHLPHLRDRVKPAESSDLRVTPEVLAFWDRRAQALGRPADWRLSDQQIEASRLAVLGQLAAGTDLWIYSYGSLMWDPGFHFEEVRLAELARHQRRFSFRTTLGRGSPERPALMLSLEPSAGACRGLVFRIAADRAHAESAVVWRREMVRGSYVPKWLAVDTPQGDVTALAFTSNPSHADHVGELPLTETAAMIASATGVLGTNRDYLEQLAEQLESLGIEDAYVQTLVARVQGMAGT